MFTIFFTREKKKTRYAVSRYAVTPLPVTPLRVLLTTHYDLKTINKNRDKMNKTFIETTILFKEMPNLVLEAKKRANFLRVRKPRNIIFHASAVVYLRKLCSFALKILKVI